MIVQLIIFPYLWFPELQLHLIVLFLLQKLQYQMVSS